MARKKKILKKQEKELLELLGNGNTMTFACESLGISRTTEWRHRNNEKNIKYRDDLEKVLERRVEMVEDALYAKAIGGDVQAIKFFLTNRSSKQWQNESFHRHTGEDPDTPIEVVAVREIIVEIPKSAVPDDDDAEAAGE